MAPHLQFFDLEKLIHSINARLPEDIRLSMQPFVPRPIYHFSALHRLHDLHHEGVIELSYTKPSGGFIGVLGNIDDEIHAGQIYLFKETYPHEEGEETFERIGLELDDRVVCKNLMIPQSKVLLSRGNDDYTFDRRTDYVKGRFFYRKSREPVSVPTDWFMR